MNIKKYGKKLGNDFDSFILVTDKGASANATNFEMSVLVASMIDSLLKQGFDKDILKMGIEVGFETYEKEQNENR